MKDRSELVERFQAFAREGRLDLWEGALAIAALVDPREDLDRARSRIVALAERVREEAVNLPALEAVRRVLFVEEAFRGDAASYDDPSNSSVAQVLAKKSGMPITLSILTIETGRLAGLRLTGVGLPGHFVVGGPDLPEGHFLDPFDGGALCDAGALALRVSTIFGSSIALTPEALAPDSSRSILMRVLFNLRRSWERRDCFDEALCALASAQALAPEDRAFLRERGLLLLRAGRSSEALESLEDYVQSGQGEDLKAVIKLIETVRAGLTTTPPGELVSAPLASRKIFTLPEARSVLPKVLEITSDAVLRYGRFSQGDESEQARQEIVAGWVREISSLGVEIKGLWLVDFDSGAGFYCWKYPEPALEYFHGYEEGFSGRLPLQ